jgi:hypothetical protein
MQSVVNGVFWCPRCGTIKSKPSWNAQESCEAPKLVARVREYTDRLGEAVISEGEDSGVIMLSHDAPTKYDATLGCHVYLHDHFSPLGDHLVRLHRDMVETVGSDEDVRLQRNVAIRHLAAWCVAVEVNGTSWDDWDEFYKDCSRKNALPEIRELLDEAIEAAKRARGAS